MSVRKKLLIIAFVLLAVDQIVKIWIKTSFTLGEAFDVFDWFKLQFIENPGMAFGMKFGNGYGAKIFLSVFRLVAVFFIGWYINRLVSKKVQWGVLVCLTMIFCGALGNLIDSMFYGLIFNESTPFRVAEFLPDEGGYAPFLCGKVVDMLYFPIIRTENFIFFRPIFNFADSYITVGVVILLLFYRKYISSSTKNEQKHD